MITPAAYGRDLRLARLFSRPSGRDHRSVDTFG